MCTLWCSHWVHRPHPPTPMKAAVRPCAARPGAGCPARPGASCTQAAGGGGVAARGGTGAAARGRAASTSARTRTRAKKSQSQRQRTQANCDSSNGTSLRGAGARAARERRRVRAARRPLAPRGGVGLCPPLEEDARAGLRRALERARQGLVAVVVAARLLPGERHVRRREQLARAAGAPVGPPRRRHSPQRSPVVVGRGAQIAKCQASSRVKAFTRKKEF